MNEQISEEWSSLTIDVSSYSAEFFHFGSTLQVQDLNENNVTDLLFIYQSHEVQYYHGDRCEMTITGKVSPSEYVRVVSVARDAAS